MQKVSKGVTLSCFQFGIDRRCVAAHVSGGRAAAIPNAADMPFMPGNGPRAPVDLGHG
jgi:hypothetical protein